MRNVDFTKAAPVEEKNRPVLDRVDYRILDVVQREGALPVAEVAARTGFFDQSHLTRHFRAIVGMPPGRYQRQQLHTRRA